MYVPVSVRIYWLPNKAVIYTINTLRQQTLDGPHGPIFSINVADYLRHECDNQEIR